MLRIILSLIFAGFISGCTSTQTVINRLNARYDGESFDEFVLKHGIPNEKYEMKNGDCVYTWCSEVESLNWPSSTSTSGFVGSGGTYYGNAFTTGGGISHHYCKLRIHVSADGKIMSIQAVKDTSGLWNFSRCAECFKEEVRGRYTNGS